MSESTGQRRPSAWVDRLRGKASLPTTEVVQAESSTPTPSPAPAPDAGWHEQLVPQAVSVDQADADADADADETSAPAAAPAAPAEIPDPYRFRPRRGRRLVVTALVVLGVVATAWLARAAYLDTDQSAVALAAGVGFATAVLWALRAAVTVTTVDVEDGTLCVARGGSRSTFDLRSHQSRVELFGTPGHRGWKVVLTRQGQAPIELDSSVVDGEELSRVLRHYRPREASSQ